MRAASDDYIVMELLFKLSQRGSADAAQVILVRIPPGFVTIVGSVRVRGVPIW